jgi:SNF2 family DNA or RNA helicase
LKLLQLLSGSSRGTPVLNGRKVLFLVGKQHCKQKQVLETVYDTHNKYILLSLITIGNVGLNFTTATVAIILTPMWNLQQEIQAIMRIY